MQIEVIRFGENEDSSDQWYETPTGERVKCNETVFDTIWVEWVSDSLGEQEIYEKDGYHTFDFNHPYNVDLDPL